MASARRSIEVAALADRVWVAVVDYDARPRWSPRVKEAKVLDGGPLGEGSRIRLQIDRDRFTATVMEIRPPSSRAWAFAFTMSTSCEPAEIAPT